MNDSSQCFFNATINSMQLLSLTYCWSWVSLVRCSGFQPGLWPSLWKCTWCHTEARAQCSDFAWCLALSSSYQQSYTNLQSRQTESHWQRTNQFIIKTLEVVTHSAFKKEVRQYNVIVCSAFCLIKYSGITTHPRILEHWGTCE